MILPSERLNSSMNTAKERHTLYVRFPHKLNEDRTLAESEVKSLNSKIIQVRIPRQRSANFCLVEFASKEDKEKALKKLKTVEVNDKRLVVKEATRNDKVKVEKKIEKVEAKRQVNDALGKLVNDIKNSVARNYAKRNVTNGVMVKELKVGTTQGSIRDLFPEAIDIKMNVKADRKNSFALVWLPTPKDANEAVKVGVVRINNEEHVVCLESDGKQRKRKRTSTSNSNDDDGAEGVSDSEGGEGNDDDGSEESEGNEDADESMGSDGDEDAEESD